MIYKNRNTPIKKLIAKTDAQKWTRGTVYSVHGNQINLRLGASPTLIKHIEVVGDISQCIPGVEVPIVWKNRRPVAMPGSTAAIPADTSSALAVSPYPKRYDLAFNHGVWNTPINIISYGGQIYYFYVRQITGALGDNISFTVPLDAGVYTINWLGILTSFSGIWDFYIDGVMFSLSNDLYINGTTTNTMLSFGPVNLAKGQHTFLFVASGKNSGSAGYVMCGTMFSIYPAS